MGEHSVRSLSLRWSDEPLRRAIKVDRSPFPIGRSFDSALVLTRVRFRESMPRSCTQDDSVLVDEKSRHGTFVNTERVSQFGSV